MAHQNRSKHSQHTEITTRAEEEVILIPAFDNSEIIARFNLSLVGRMFNKESRSTEALLAFMPKKLIWDVEGRVRGIDLGEGKFQFDFKEEKDLVKVLSKRPCHFNKWSFSQERWIPSIREDFPNTMLFWVHIIGVPTHYWSEVTFRHIGQALGQVELVDVEGARIQVTVNADEALIFERKTQFVNGDTITTKMEYEKIFRFCFHCKKISHEERTCRELLPARRTERNQGREQPISREATYRPPTGLNRGKYPETYHRVERRDHGSSSYALDSRMARGIPRRDRDVENSYRPGRQDKSVWNRLDHSRGSYPLYREKNLLPKEEPYKKKRSQDYSQVDKAGDSQNNKYFTSKTSSKNTEENPKKRHLFTATTESFDSQRTITDIKRREPEVNSPQCEKSRPRLSTKASSQLHWQAKSNQDTDSKGEEALAEEVETSDNGSSAKRKLFPAEKTLKIYDEEEQEIKRKNEKLIEASRKGKEKVEAYRELNLRPQIPSGKPPIHPWRASSSHQSAKVARIAAEEADENERSILDLVGKEHGPEIAREVIEKMRSMGDQDYLKSSSNQSSESEEENRVSPKKGAPKQNNGGFNKDLYEPIDWDNDDLLIEAVVAVEKSIEKSIRKTEEKRLKREALKSNQTGGNLKEPKTLPSKGKKLIEKIGEFTEKGTKLKLQRTLDEEFEKTIDLKDKRKKTVGVGEELFKAKALNATPAGNPQATEEERVIVGPAIPKPTKDKARSKGKGRLQQGQHVSPIRPESVIKKKIPRSPAWVGKVSKKMNLIRSGTSPKKRGPGGLPPFPSLFKFPPNEAVSIVLIVSKNIVSMTLGSVVSQKPPNPKI